MASKLFVFVCVSMAIFNIVSSAVLGRIGGCGCGACGACNNIFPEQLINGAFISGGLNPSFLPAGPAYNPVVYDQPTTIIQDSTVANNLANALQLLVVSNLLSSTLPFEQTVPVPVSGGLAPIELLSAPLAVAPSLGAPFGCGCGGCGCNNCGLAGPYNIIY